MNDELNIGPKSKKCLNKIGILSKTDLIEMGAVAAFVKMKRELSDFKPSLNFLYALVAIIEETNWKVVAKNEKGRLLMELEDYQEFEGIFTKKTKNRSLNKS